MSNAIPQDVMASAEWTEVSRHFGRLMERLATDESAAVGFAGALAVERMLSGHVCVDLKRAAGTRVFPDAPGEMLLVPAADDWIRRLRDSGVVGQPGETRPLILDAAGRLYLLRQWRDEQTVAAGIRARLEAPQALADAAKISLAWRRHFPDPDAGVDWQRVAVFAALRNRFAVITGGPGTGKTRTVGVLLAMLREVHPEARFALAAPTGKAAARLQESVGAVLQSLPLGEGMRERASIEARTLHRLLGARPGGGFRHDAEEPLPFDSVIVDEASMVDLATMAALMRALPAGARLVLVGDKDQLSSVETGAVLGDVCSALAANEFTPEFAGELNGLSGIKLEQGSVVSGAANAVVQLSRNYRQAGADGVRALAAALLTGDVAQVALLEQRADAAGGLLVNPLPASGNLKAALAEWWGDRWTTPKSLADADGLLKAIGSFRVLAALRDGPWGVRRINRLIEEILSDRGIIDAGGGQYPGRPVLVTENDYATGLFNGDVGVIVPDQGGLRAVFPDSASAGVRAIEITRLPAHETVFAMTIHKAQGSEFDDVLMILPERNHPLLTCELAYTGLTRARRTAVVWAGEGVLASAAVIRAQRESGLLAVLKEG